MSLIPGTTVAGRKTGKEDIIMIRLPMNRFRDSIPAHFAPLPIGDKGLLCQVMLLAQTCERNSFDNCDAGKSDELHFWLQIGSSKPLTPINGADVMLPSMHWFALHSASSNVTALNNLHSFGFTPFNLDSTDLRNDGGLTTFKNGEYIHWIITGPGEKLNRVGVNHFLFTSKDEPDTEGHHIEALLSDTVMKQPAKVHIQTAALEPFLSENEGFEAVIHRVSKLEADIVWHQNPI